MHPVPCRHIRRCGWPVNPDVQWRVRGSRRSRMHRWVSESQWKLEAVCYGLQVRIQVVFHVMDMTESMVVVVVVVVCALRIGALSLGGWGLFSCRHRRGTDLV